MSDYQDCARCHRTMRPRRSPAADHPDTTAPGARGLCQTCPAWSTTEHHSSPTSDPRGRTITL